MAEIQTNKHDSDRYARLEFLKASSEAHGHEADRASTVEHPQHYNQVPNLECITVVQHFNFNIGCAIKYLWRYREKGNPVEDLKKARQYIDFEIARIEEFGL